MSLKSIVRELREMKEGIGNISRRGLEGMYWRNRNCSHIAPDVAISEPIEQGQWANLPPELLLDIIERVEESETLWPARAAVVFCASVCKTWREVTKEIVKTPEKCGRLTLPLSLKQPGPRDFPIQCYIRRDRETSTFRLYFGLAPSENENDKMLLAAKKVRRATSTDFVISLAADDFSRASNAYIGKLKSNFLGTKFTIYDNQPPDIVAVQQSTRSYRRFSPKQVSPKISARNYRISTITYELNVLRTSGPRRVNCVMHTIPISSIQEGGKAPTPTSFLPSLPEKSSLPPASGGKEPSKDLSSTSLAASSGLTGVSREPLLLKNKSPRWHEHLQCWCLNFRGRVTVASIKNFQLVAAVDESHNVPSAAQEKVILQFGKIGKDIFTMDYGYPLSAFQAFAICLSSFDTKPARE